MKRSNYWQLLPYLRPELPTIGRALLCTLVFTSFWPLLAWLAGRMANYLAQGAVENLARLAGVAAVMFLVRGAAQFGQDALMARASLQIVLNLRAQTYAHLQALSLNYFETARTGDLAYRLTEDIDRIGEVINKFFHDFTPCVLQVVVVLGYMVYLNWQLTVAVAVIAPLMALLIGAFGEKLLQFSRRAQARISNLSSLLTEVLSGIRLVQAFAAQEYEIGRFVQEAEQNRRVKYLAERIKALQFVVVGFLEAMSLVVLLLLGGWQISRQNLTASEFVSYAVAVAMLIDPIAHLTDNYNQFKQGEASVDRIFELLALKPLVIETNGAIALPQVTGKVELRQVWFSYPGTAGNGSGPVLKGISFLACPGESVALVGSSGAGKTTLVNLLLRFYDPEAGQVLLDGVDVRAATLDSLRRQIGLVPQETILFTGTIAQNIAFGQTHWEADAVEAAAKIANAHQFIVQLPQGYETYVGERGVNLSGGQRQRLAIARAVLKNPRILILDEATSSLDGESEGLVQEALERIRQERTVFIIAHRLATVRRATRILVLERGEIIESGTHEELLAKNGRYAQFHARQFPDFS